MPPLHYLPIGIFAVVYALIALRNFRRFKIPIWTIMLAGAVAMIFSGAIPLQDAYAAINLDVIFFLLGMFSIVAAMELSGLLLGIRRISSLPCKAAFQTLCSTFSTF